MAAFYTVSDHWCEHIPMLHRALADAQSIHAVPYASGVATLEEACASWETVHYLFKSILGWESPGHGLAWWYQAGKPTDDPRLKLVREYWDDHYQLDYYAAWAWRDGIRPFDLDTMTTEEIAKTSLYPHEDWWRDFKRRGQSLRHDPFYGGSNPLHLGHSDDFGMEHVREDDPQPILHANPKERTALLVVTSIGHWRRNLINMGSQLPKLGDHSWHVEVFDRQVGYLGLFRQSRVTGKWFMGKHSVHVQGNPVR